MANHKATGESPLTEAPSSAESPLRRKLRSKSPNKRKPRNPSDDGGNLLGDSPSIQSSPDGRKRDRQRRSKSFSVANSISDSSHGNPTRAASSSPTRTSHRRASMNSGSFAEPGGSVLDSPTKSSKSSSSSKQPKSPNKSKKKSSKGSRRASMSDMSNSGMSGMSGHSKSSRGLLSKSAHGDGSLVRSRSSRGLSKSEHGDSLFQSKARKAGLGSSNHSRGATSLHSRGGNSNHSRGSSPSKSPSKSRRSRTKSLYEDDTDEEGSVTSFGTQKTANMSLFSSNKLSQSSNHGPTTPSNPNQTASGPLGAYFGSSSTQAPEPIDDDDTSRVSEGGGFSVVSAATSPATFTQFRRSSLENNSSAPTYYAPSSPLKSPVKGVSSSFSDDDAAVSTSPRRARKRAEGANRRGSMNAIYSKPTKDMDEKEQMARLAADMAAAGNDSADDTSAPPSPTRRMRSLSPSRVIPIQRRASLEGTMTGNDSANDTSAPPSPTRRMRSVSPSRVIPIQRRASLEGTMTTSTGPSSPSKSSSSSPGKKKKKKKEGHARVNKAMLKIQMMHLDQRNKERTARLERAKERISNEEEARKAAANAKKEMTTEERRQLAYQWYTRCGFPHIGEFKKRVRLMRGACEITERDIDLLPWMAGGKRVNAKKMFTAQQDEIKGNVVAKQSSNNQNHNSSSSNNTAATETTNNSGSTSGNAADNTNADDEGSVLVSL